MAGGMNKDAAMQVTSRQAETRRNTNNEQQERIQYARLIELEANDAEIRVEQTCRTRMKREALSRSQ
jgi:hypothetical protein